MILVQTYPQMTISADASCYHSNYHEIRFCFDLIDFYQFHPSNNRRSFIGFPRVLASNLKIPTYMHHIGL